MNPLETWDIRRLLLTVGWGKTMKAMLLAAGLGTRLRPVTHWIPKSMMPVLGVPIIEHNLIQLRGQGFREVIVNLHHMPFQIIHHLKDGSPWGVKILYSLEPTIMGTAGAIKKVEEHLGGETFLVINADTYRSVDLQGLVRHHRENPATITMLLQENRCLDPDKAVWVDRSGAVVRFLEHIQSEWSQAVPADFLGVQVMEPKVFSFIPPHQPWDVHKLYLRLLNSDSEMKGSLQSGYWKDIGSLTAYRQIHMDALDRRCPIRIPGSLVREGVWMASEAHMEPGVRVEPPVFLGTGTLVREGASIGPYAVLGSHCVVGRGAYVAGSIIWDGVRIQGDSFVEDLLVSRDFRLPLPAR